MGYQRDARIEWRPAENGMELECPYNKDFQEDLKKAVPFADRKFIKRNGEWRIWVSDAYLDEVDILIFHHFERSSTGREF